MAKKMLPAFKDYLASCGPDGQPGDQPGFRVGRCPSAATTPAARPACHNRTGGGPGRKLRK